MKADGVAGFGSDAGGFRDRCTSSRFRMRRNEVAREPYDLRFRLVIDAGWIIVMTLSSALSRGPDYVPEFCTRENP